MNESHKCELASVTLIKMGTLIKAGDYEDGIQKLKT